MNSLLQQILDEFQCQTGTIHRADAAGEFLHLVTECGIPPFLLDKITTIPFGKGIAGHAASSAGPIELCNLQQDLGGVAKEDAKKTGCSGSIALPIFSASSPHQVIGTLGIGKTIPYQFSAQEITRLQNISAQLALTLLKEIAP